MEPQHLMPAAPTQSKDLPVVKVIFETACCYREHRYEPTDPRHACHLGLKKLDFAICGNCIHFGVRPPQVVKLLSGGEAMAVRAMLETMAPTHNTETGDRPEGAIKLDETEG